MGVMAFECMFGRVNLKIVFNTNLHYRDPMSGKLERISEIISYQNKSKLKDMKYPEVGRLKQPIS